MLLPIPGAAADLPKLQDPLFGLTVDPATVHFDPAPADLPRLCPDLTNARWDRMLLVFARTEDPSATYFVLGGYFVRRGGAGQGGPSVETDPRGAVARVQGAQCILVGPAREVFDYGADEVSTATLRDLAADAVQRYARAFGGMHGFQTALQRQHVDLTGPRAAILRDAVNAAATAR